MSIKEKNYQPFKGKHSILTLLQALRTLYLSLGIAIGWMFLSAPWIPNISCSVKYWFWWKISFEEIWRFETNLMIFIVSSSVLKEFIRTRGTLESYLEFHRYRFTITQGKMKKYDNVFKVCTFCSGILSAGQSGRERWDHFGPEGITNIIQQRKTYNVQHSLIFFMCIMLSKNTTVI